MQQFNDSKGKRRLVNITNMKKEEAKEFYYQFPQIPEEERKKFIVKLKNQIKRNHTQNPYKWILSIHSKWGKLVGKIEVNPLAEEQKVCVHIQICNDSWVMKYGMEAIDQFIKICRENKYFKEIQLAPDPVTEQYKNMHAMKNYIVKVA